MLVNFKTSSVHFLITDLEHDRGRVGEGTTAYWKSRDWHGHYTVEKCVRQDFLWEESLAVIFRGTVKIRTRRPKDHFNETSLFYNQGMGVLRNDDSCSRPQDSRGWSWDSNLKLPGCGPRAP